MAVHGPVGSARVALGSKKAGWLVGAAFVAVAAAWPVLGQESLLPPGFDSPPAGRPQSAPSPSPAPTPSPGPRSPSSGSPSPVPAPSPPRIDPSLDEPAVSTAERTADRTDRSDGRPQRDGEERVLADGTIVTDDGEIAAPPPRYDLPPGSRRTLTRIGPLSTETGGLPVDAFGSRGIYASRLMDNLRQPIVSRWSFILLRRALLSGVDTPRRINGADFVASRANLLLRQGDAAGARLLVQSVDVDKASPRLRQIVMPVFLANADPAGLCSYVPVMAGTDDNWKLTQGMCAAMVGESGTATALVDRVRRSGRLSPIDVKLAEKVVGAGLASRRSVSVKWDDVETLTPWRLGLATAVGVEIPAGLWSTATPTMRQWAMAMPMIPAEQRFAFGADAAARGTLSSRAYVDLVSMTADSDEPADAIVSKGRQLRAAFMLADLSARVEAILALGTADNGGYAGQVLGARAAARIGPVDLSDDDNYGLLAAMFAGGLDRNAMAWAEQTAVGSQGWGLLAVGSPRPLVGVSADRVDDFAADDDSVNQHRTRMLAAALIGLERISSDDSRTLASDYTLGLGQESDWSRAIDLAAQRGETGTVAVLAAVGLQGRDWQGVPPRHIYHITRALRIVGLGAEARMIAAEAVTRS